MSTIAQPQITDWNTFYEVVPADDVPWELGLPSYELTRAVTEGFMVAPSRILDVGCGLGTQAIYMAKNGFEVFGVDIATRAIEKAKKLAQFSQVKVSFKHADVLALPYGADSFDIIYDRGCFHHLKSREQEIYKHEISRVLTDGGTFLLVVFAQALSGNELEQFFTPAFELVDEEIFSYTEKGTGNTIALRSLTFEKQASQLVAIN